MQRRYYSKFPNVCMGKKFNPPLHDFGEMEELERQGKYKWNFYLEFVDKEKDIHLCHLGFKRIFDLLSIKAFEEFNVLWPDKIDKFTDLQEISFAKTFYGAVNHQPSNSGWKRRREIFTKAIGLNYSSRYISLIVENAKTQMDKWKEGSTINLIESINKITLTVISSIILGRDFDEKMKLMKYTNLDGSEEMLDFYSFFPRLSNSLIRAVQIPINLLFPFLIKSNLTRINKINFKNILAFRQGLKDFLCVTTDFESWYKQILSEHPEYNYEDLFKDLQGFLFDGYETMSKCFCSTVYFLQKWHHSQIKVKEELCNVGIEQNENLISSITYERLQEMNYLLMVIKESLRIDTPLVRSMHYYAKEDIQIWGVPLPKGSVMSMWYMARHFDPKQWQEPYNYNCFNAIETIIIMEQQVKANEDFLN